MQLDDLYFNLTRIINDYLSLIGEKILHADDSLEIVGLQPLLSDFQCTLLKTLIVLLFVNIFLIFLFWTKYGAVITDKFIRPSTLKEIEELKLSVARLKLPKDYTPRI